MKIRVLIALAIFVPALVPAGAFADEVTLSFGQEQFVRADAVDIAVPGYSVPSFVDWDNDGRKDLVIGEGSGSYPPGKVRVYLNTATDSEPQFSAWFYAQSAGSDLTCTASGCMGCFPRVVYWDADDAKDLLVGESTGKLKLFLNNGTDQSPTFDAGNPLQVGPPGSKMDMYVGSRPTPAIVDWNNDGRKDLVVGSVDGMIRLFINEGTDTEPDFRTTAFVQIDGSNLDIGSRSSPDVIDLDADGKKDLLTGNTEGQLLFYTNVGTDAEPLFAGYSLVESAGAPIDIPGSARSRPFVCYWTDDAYPDILVGADDGKVRLYEGIPAPGDLNADGRVDLEDFALFAAQWRRTGCGECGRADLVDDDSIDLEDLAEFAAKWLNPAG
jgi:hypothetical protein